MQKTILPALGLALLLATPAQAQRDDKSQPVNFTANTGEVNYQTKIGNLSGNVVITQGTMTIRADRITFKQNADNSISATAHGNPITFRQKRDGVDEYFEGYAQRAEYDGEKELLELFDRALLKRSTDEIRSNYISYNTRTEQFRAEGRPDTATAPPDSGPGARVRGVFQPRSEDKSGGDVKSGTSTPQTKPVAKPVPLTLKRSPDVAPKGGK
jgi:lipopolysaccharide export system protein LptA